MLESDSGGPYWNQFSHGYAWRVTNQNVTGRLGIILADTRVRRFWDQPRRHWLTALFVVVAIIFALTFRLATLTAFLEKYRTFGLVACLFAYVSLSVTPIPSEPVTLLVLAWKGPIAAIITATLGNILAATMEFYIGHSLGDMTDFEKKKEKLAFHLGQLQVNSPVFLLVARMLPGFGPKFVSLAGGLYRVPLITYLWTATGSNLIGAVFLVLGGYGLIKLFR
jgi:uncharacterized membrane protein YdjX (TVP38/TMEM64 family)